MFQWNTPQMLGNQPCTQLLGNQRWCRMLGN